MAQEAWITTQQRINLNKLVISNPDCTPADCCEIAHNLDDAHFIEAHESIGYEVSLSMNNGNYYKFINWICL